MTAAIQPAKIVVEHKIVSIHIDLNHQGLALSVIQPTSEVCQTTNLAFVAPLERDGIKSATPALMGAIAQKSARPDETAVETDEAFPEDFSSSNMTCSGPATPEQADTISAQDLDGSEKPTLALVAAVASAEISVAHNGTGNSELKPQTRQEAVVDRFTCWCASDSRAGDSNGPEPATLLTDDASSVTGGTNACSYKDSDASAMVPACPVREQSDAGVALSVKTGPATTGSAEAPTCDVQRATELVAVDEAPVTPTTPPRPAPDAPLLPPAADPHRMTLVLDLDGTLIASEDEPHAPVAFDYCVDEERFVWLRPGLRRFLDSVRPHFEVVLFTAAGESWASSALQRIDPEGVIFDSRLHRDHTVSHDDWPWVKDLSRLGRDLARVVIVDDNPLMFMYQPDNALHVAAYDPQLTGHNDDVLEQVLDVLMHKVLIANDVREVLRNMKDPITASCMAARHAAAKAAAAGAASQHGTAARTGAGVGHQGSQPRRGGAPSKSSSASSAGRDASEPASTQILQDAAGGGAAVKLSRRCRRLAKQHQQQQQEQQQQSASPPPQQQQQQQQKHGTVLVQTHSVASAAGGLMGLSAATDGSKPQPEKKSRRQRSRRRNPGGGAGVNAGTAPANGTGTVLDGVRAAPRGYVVPNAVAPAQGSPVIVSRVRGAKQSLKGGAAQPGATLLLQQPEQQLHLKLKLLQLQREQEEAEGEGSQEGEEDEGADRELGPGPAVPVLRGDAAVAVVAAAAVATVVMVATSPQTTASRESQDHSNSFTSSSHTAPLVVAPPAVEPAVSVPSALPAAAATFSLRPAASATVGLASRPSATVTAHPTLPMADSNAVLPPPTGPGIHNRVAAAVATAVATAMAESEVNAGQQKPRSRRRRRRPADAASHNADPGQVGGPANNVPVEVSGTAKSIKVTDHLNAAAAWREIQDRA